MTAETPEQRSRIMRAIKARDTKPELLVRRMVHAIGGRFRLHRKDLPGTPDLVFPSARKVIFVHGCFWHGHTCRRGDRMPATNQVYWRNKIDRNRRRDRTARATLRGQGWDVLVIWECQINPLRMPSLRKRLRRFLSKPVNGAARSM